MSSAAVIALPRLRKIFVTFSYSIIGLLDAGAGFGCEPAFGYQTIADVRFIYNTPLGNIGETGTDYGGESVRNARVAFD
jgi:hypothetical protein